MYGHIGQLEGSGGGVVGLPQAPLAQLLFLPGQFDVLYENNEFIAYSGAVNLPDRHCLHPCLTVLEYSALGVFLCCQLSITY